MTRKRKSEPELTVSPAPAASPSRRKAAARTTTRAKRSAVEADVPSTSVAEPEIAAVQAVAAVASYAPSAEEIAELAYLYWEARGCQGGSPEEDWFRAEMQLRSRAIAATA